MLPPPLHETHLHEARDCAAPSAAAHAEAAVEACVGEAIHGRGQACLCAVRTCGASSTLPDPTTAHHRYAADAPTRWGGGSVG